MACPWKGHLLIISLLVLIACEGEDNQVYLNPVGEPEYVVETIIPTGDEQYLNTGSAYIFDQDKLLTFELNLPASSLSRINNNPVTWSTK